MSLPSRPLRTHQAQLAAIVQAIVSGQTTELTDILAAVTPGGGKSLLPVIAAAALVSANIIERVCWVVPCRPKRRLLIRFGAAYLTTP